MKKTDPNDIPTKAFSGRPKEVSRRRFSDNIWEIEYEDGKMGLEGEPSTTPDEPILPMDAKATEIKPEILQSMKENADPEIEDTPLKMVNLKIGKDISKEQAKIMLKNSENFSPREREQGLKDLENDDMTHIALDEDWMENAYIKEGSK